MIEFTNFSFQYLSQQEPTLKDINLTIHQGEKVLIVGPSGSGKSTLAHCINGLVPYAYKGEILGEMTINGTSFLTETIFQRSKRLGTVLQDADGQFVGLTCAEDIAFALENDCVPQQAMIDRVFEVARIVEMEDFLGQSPYDLSGGQKQKVALAGVLVDDVDILLFDEPLANLDPASGKTTIELIDQLHKNYNKTIIIIEHRLEDVLHRHIDRIVLINEGMIIYNGDVDTLLRSNLLVDHGIREPLYLSAMKRAKVDLSQPLSDINLLDINSLVPLKTRYQKIKQPALNESKELLGFSHVNFGYTKDKLVIQDMSFSIYENEMLSIVGRNGAGKSTISKLILGFMKPQSGVISYQGKNMSEMTIFERSQLIGLVLQDPNQMISKTMIFDEVAFGLRNRGEDENTIQRKVEETLKICGLAPFIDWPISALSFGQKKRVTIASVLVMGPKIIMLDEPTAGQDYAHYCEILDFLVELHHLGHTIVMITHDMHLMLEYTSRCLVLNEHRLIADSQPYQVLCSEEVIKAANLKTTSLFTLANYIGVEPEAFVQSFIAQEWSHDNE
jgi:energy-coupling factor transport system ATP-binding protein